MNNYQIGPYAVTVKEPSRDGATLCTAAYPERTPTLLERMRNAVPCGYKYCTEGELCEQCDLLLKAADVLTEIRRITF